MRIHASMRHSHQREMRTLRITPPLRKLSRERRARLVKDILLVAAVAIVYFVAGKLGLKLAFVHPSATAVWAPTGLALAGFLLLGYRIWPGIFLGALLVNLTTAGSFFVCSGIATGNTLEGLLGAYLLNRFAEGKKAFDSPQGILAFVLLGALFSTTVSATLGVTSLSLGGTAPWSSYGAIWLTWWMGDAVGDLLIAPLVILYSTKPQLKWNPVRVVEIILLLLYLIFVGQLTFGGLYPAMKRDYPLEFLCVPALVWAAFRFRPRRAALATLLVAIIAVRGTLHGFGPFVRESRNQSLLLVQGFMGVMALMTLVLAAVV